MLRFRVAGASHDGLVRPHNEDAGFVGPYLLLVADGVGGSVAGEVAAASAAYVVTAAATMSEVDDPLVLLSEAILLAHAHLAHGCAVVTAGCDPGAQRGERPRSRDRLGRRPDR